MISEAVRIRRDLHRWAELAFLEVRTAARVLAEISDLPGITIRTGHHAMHHDAVVDYPSRQEQRAAIDAAVAHGIDRDLASSLAEAGTAIVVDIPGGQPGPVWALRFDMDALPITEAADATHPPAALGFRSETAAMHACGHDGHTAIGIAVAKNLASSTFPGHVRLLFQPAEEGARGAATMLSAGVLDDVDRFLALHLGHSLPTGTTVGSGDGIQATAKFRATFTGAAAHAAGAPQDGRNALAAVASATLHLLGLPRSSHGLTNVNVGTISGGEATNIIPAGGTLTAEVRSDSADVCADLVRRARRVVEASAQMWDVTSDFTITARSTTLAPDEALVDEVVAVAADLFGPDAALRSAPMPASDDATIFARQVQERGGLASYVMVGAGNVFPHHHSRFDIDERSIDIAVRWLTAVVLTGGAVRNRSHHARPPARVPSEGR